MKSSFKPFLISAFKTGQFNYLKPWISPTEAFEPLDNAYIYRGVLNKRAGYTIFGRMAYTDNNIALGNGGTTYSGTLALFPIVPGSFNPGADTMGGETFTDNGLGVLTGSAGGSGTIVYSTGVWSLTFGSNVASHVNIYATYQPNLSRPIMGIKVWISESNDSTLLVIMDTARAAYYNVGTDSFVPLDEISQVLWVGDGVSTSKNFLTGWVAQSPYTQALAPYSISITDGTSTITDNGSGGLSSSGNFAAGGTVNYATGGISLNFTGAPATTVTITLTADLIGDYFTGTTADFFNSTNWLGPSAAWPSGGYLYMTNNSDPITVFNGTTLSRPPFSITLADFIGGVNDIAKCLDVDVYQNRFLVQRPTLVGQSNPAGQSIRWSQPFNPSNLAADIPGNGGELSAPTDDFLQASEFLRDQLIVFFTNSAWSFRYTGSDFDPFRWYKLNVSKATNAPYGTVAYDERVTSMGVQGLIACDGVNVQRYDSNVIDQFLDINQGAFQQCYGIRFDNVNQAWMLYPSAATGASLSDSVLVYNFAEETWATFSMPMSCLGLYQITSGSTTWNSYAANGPTPLTWEEADLPWNSYIFQGLAPTLLGGALSGGYIYILNSGSADFQTSNSLPVPISASMTSAQWNPFAPEGQKVQFGYIDFYYTINPNCVLNLVFYTDNLTSTTATRTLTLDGPADSTYNWKRIYVNIVGEFLKMDITNNQAQTFQILGMVLWASPSGRLTPGFNV